MRKLVLLFLLLCWNHHASGHWLRCSTGEVITNHAVSLPSSKHAGAKVFLLRKYQASSRIHCIEACCSGIYGLCSVVEYRNVSEDANCVYYSCQPISKCKFMEMEGTDTFSFPYIGQNISSTYNSIHTDGEDHDKTKQKALTGSTRDHLKQRTSTDHAQTLAFEKSVEATPASNEDSSALWDVSTGYMENNESSKQSFTVKDHIRTVTARKGVEFVSGSTNVESPGTPLRVSAEHLQHDASTKTFHTVTTQYILSETDSSFKNDNTTIKPRKGVDLENELSSAKIKPRKGVEIMRPLNDTIDASEPRKSRVKPRKGVSSLPLSVTTVPIVKAEGSSEFPQKLSSTTSTAAGTSIKSFNLTSPSYSTVSTDLISVLEQVFREDSDSLEVKSKLPYSTHSVTYSTSDTFSVSSTPASSVKYHEYSTLSLNSAMQSSSILTPSSSLPIRTVLPSKTWSHQEPVSESTPPLTTAKLSSSSQSRVSGRISSPSHSPVVKTSMNVEYSVSSDENSHHYDEAVLLFTVSSSNKTIRPVLSASDDSWENERKYKSSMHLVLSLVFGLLVLFVVLGAVAKRVYDVWMRRHYHRMDFLIDGMYDGFS